MDIKTEKEISISEDSKIKILRFPFKEIDNAFIIVSFKSQTISKDLISFYTKYPEPYCRTEPIMSFFYAGPREGAEWLPPYGPIMVYTKCDKDWIGKTDLTGATLKAREHWFYDYVEDNRLAFSQLAVDDEQLVRKLHLGDFKGIFSSLKSWALRSDL